MAVHHHAITFSAGTGVGIFAILQLMTDRVTKLIETTEATQSCINMIQTVISLF